MCLAVSSLFWGGLVFEELLAEDKHGETYQETRGKQNRKKHGRFPGNWITPMITQAQIQADKCAQVTKEPAPTRKTPEPNQAKRRKHHFQPPETKNKHEPRATQFKAKSGECHLRQRLREAPGDEAILQELPGVEVARAHVQPNAAQPEATSLAIGVILWMVAKSVITLKPWLKPLFVGI